MSQSSFFRDQSYLPAPAKIVHFESPDPLLAVLEESGRFGSFQFSFQTGVLEWSSEMFRRYGFEPTDSISTDDSMERVHPDDRETIQKTIIAAADSGSGYTLEYRVRRPDGEIFWLLTRGQIQRNNDGSPARILGIALDISAMKRAEEAEREARRQVLSLVESVTASFVAVDRQWRFTYMNSRALERAGKTRDELMGVNVWEVFPELVDTQLYTEYHRVMRERVPSRFQLSLQRGDPVWYDVHAFPTAEGMAALVQDITELKLAEEALRKSEKLAATGRLAATISHEINNPLEAVTNLLYLSMSEPELPERVRQYLVDADDELKRVAGIVRQTLGFYRETKTFRTTNLSELVRAVLHLYRKRFETKHVRLITEFDMSLYASIMDGEIKQVITNFVTNALDATEAEGMIHARVWEEEGCANISIEDNGSGISEESRLRLFEPFFTTKVNVGTGLGLWISKEIADKHAGTIEVETNTTAANHGTKFTLRIPLRLEKSIEP